MMFGYNHWIFSVYIRYVLHASGALQLLQLRTQVYSGRVLMVPIYRIYEDLSYYLKCDVILIVEVSPSKGHHVTETVLTFVVKKVFAIVKV